MQKEEHLFPPSPASPIVVIKSMVRWRIQQMPIGLPVKPDSNMERPTFNGPRTTSLYVVIWIIFSTKEPTTASPSNHTHWKS